jgi:uncharacterized protein (DUF2225 family)
MLPWSTQEASCPICDRRVRLRQVGGGFALGQDSDLLVRMKGKHVIQAEIHNCPKCHFAGYASEFLGEIGSEAREKFLEEVSPWLVLGLLPKCSARADYSQAPTPDVQYYWAYKTSEALSLPVASQAEKLLRAYWCMRLPPSTGLPSRTREALRKVYLSSAIRKLRQALRTNPGGHRVYLIAELCRRSGNFLLSAGYFRRFLEKETGPRYLKQAASRLLEAARAGLSREMSMEEILMDGATGTAGRIDEES